MYLRNGRVGVIDLGSLEVSEEPLPDGDVLRSLALAQSLTSRHGQDSLVLGTGVLTASFVPASCAGFVLAGAKLMPMLGFAGVELKLSGFDFIVVKGRSERRGYLWVRDGMMELVESDAVAGGDAWRRTDSIRSEQGDAKIQVVTTGPWGDARSEASQAVIDYWGGEDKVGMGSEFGKRNLAAVAFRGMGDVELDEPDKHFEDSVLLMSEHMKRLGPSEGLASYSELATRSDFRSLVHRHVACYGCPRPCRSFLKVYEEPGELRLASREPGYLHYDVPAMARCISLGLDARSATLFLIACARAGAEPVSVLESASRSSDRPSLDLLVSSLKDPASLPNARALNFESSFARIEDYRACLDLGVCPRYWSVAGFDFGAVAEFARSAGAK
ncbi:MAG: aldehyde ferredoxin oxidoreductase N-terminal domain-containing protein [Thermoplasmata archaeon]